MLGVPFVASGRRRLVPIEDHRSGPQRCAYRSEGLIFGAPLRNLLLPRALFPGACRPRLIGRPLRMSGKKSGTVRRRLRQGRRASARCENHALGRRDRRAPGIAVLFARHRRGGASGRWVGIRAGALSWRPRRFARAPWPVLGSGTSRASNQGAGDPSGAAWRAPFRALCRPAPAVIIGSDIPGACAAPRRGGVSGHLAAMDGRPWSRADGGYWLVWASSARRPIPAELFERVRAGRARMRWRTTRGGSATAIFPWHSSKRSRTSMISRAIAAGQGAAGQGSGRG